LKTIIKLETSTVHLTLIYYWVPGNQEFCVAPSKTNIVGQIKIYFVSAVALSDVEELQRNVSS
jgi:hypothetical protein